MIQFDEHIFSDGLKQKKLASTIEINYQDFILGYSKIIPRQRLGWRARTLSYVKISTM